MAQHYTGVALRTDSNKTGLRMQVCGIKDLPLMWVKNIQHFGGDPHRDTVLGQSAGGGSIMHQITAFGGLKGNVPFHQAIIQSPGFLPLNSNAQIEAIFQETVDFASLISGKTISATEDLRSLFS